MKKSKLFTLLALLLIGTCAIHGVAANDDDDDDIEDIMDNDEDELIHDQLEMRGELVGDPKIVSRDVKCLGEFVCVPRAPILCIN